MKFRQPSGKAGCSILVSILLLVAGPSAGDLLAQPRTPVDQTEVLEFIDSPLIFSSNDWRDMHRRLREDPQNTSLAATLAKEYIEQGRGNF